MSVNRLEGKKRPIVDAETACRVEQLADKRDISNKEAYTLVVEAVLDPEGNPKIDISSEAKP